MVSGWGMTMSSEEGQLPSIGTILHMTFEKWYVDNIPRHAAVLAFYALFALAPILLLAVEIMGLVYGRAAAEAQVLAQVKSLVNSPETADWVKTLLSNVLPSSASWWVTAGFVVALIYGASNFFNELKHVLNQIWGVSVSSGTGLVGAATERAQAVLMVLVGSLLIFFGLVVTKSLSTAADWAATYLDLGTGYALWSYIVLLFLLLTLFFSLIYKFVPNVIIAWQDVIIGAAATALLISVTRLLISWYFSYSHVTTMFGATSALVVILLWVYYSAQIFFLGAEFTYVYCRTYGMQWQEISEPKRGAVGSFIANGNSFLDRLYRDDDHNNVEELEAFGSTWSSHETPQTKPAGPIELEVRNIETNTVAVGQEPAEEKLVKKRWITQLYGRALKSWKWLRRGEEQNGDKSAADLRSLRPPPEQNHSQKRASRQNPRINIVGRKRQFFESGDPQPKEENVSRTVKMKVRLSAARVLFRRLVAMPLRIMRPVREIIVAAGIIGALSLATLIGVPWWRKRDGGANTQEEKRD